MNAKWTPDYFSVEAKYGSTVARIYNSHGNGYSVAVNKPNMRAILAKVLRFYHNNWSLTKRINNKTV